MAIDTHTGEGAGPESSSQRLLSQLDLYGRRVRRDRRVGAVTAGLIVLGIAWVLIAFAPYFGVAASKALVLGVALTVALPVLALALESLTRPSLLQTARLIDARTDRQQRIVTALELSSRGEHGSLDAEQVASTVRYLDSFAPKAVVPVRSARPGAAIFAGLLCLALAIFALKGLGSQFVPYQAQTLADLPQGAGAVATPTQQSGLPGAEQTPSPTPSADVEAALPSPTLQGGNSQGDNSSSSNGSSASNDASTPPTDPQASDDAKHDLQQLGQALNGQSAAQSAADNLRDGNYGQAAQDLKDLGTNSDQLSDGAKQDLSNALNQAADQTTDNSLAQAERQAASSLKNGDYDKSTSDMNQLGQAIQNTAGNVMSQQQMAQSYPSPTAGAATGQSPQQPGDSSQQSSPQGSQQNNQGSQNQTGEAGQAGQSGQPQQGQQGNQSGQGDQNGQQGSQSGPDGSADSGQQGANDTSPQGGGSDSTSNDGQNGQPQVGPPGTGHKDNGPTEANSAQGGSTNPFQLDNQSQQPNKPGDANQPALSLDTTTSGSSSGPAPVAPGTASTLPAENGNLPVDRWTVIQRYFNGK